MESEETKPSKKKGGLGCLITTIILFVLVVIFVSNESERKTFAKSLENTTWRLSSGNDNWVIIFADEYGVTGYPDLKYSYRSNNAYLGKELKERGAGFILSVDEKSNIIHCSIYSYPNILGVLGEYWVPEQDDYVSLYLKYKAKDGKVVSLSIY